jgi:hypothetical protein
VPPPKGFIPIDANTPYGVWLRVSAGPAVNMGAQEFVSAKRRSQPRNGCTEDWETENGGSYMYPKYWQPPPNDEEFAKAIGILLEP